MWPCAYKITEAEMKLQVFLYGYYNYAQAVADQLAKKFTCKCDTIPPAYQCNEEKLVFVVYEKYGPLEDKLIDWLTQLTPKKVQNIALIEISNKGNEGVDKITEILTKQGVNVCAVKNLLVKRALFSKAKAVAPEQIQEALDFADEQGKANFEFLRKQA